MRLMKSWDDMARNALIDNKNAIVSGTKYQRLTAYRNSWYTISVAPIGHVNDVIAKPGIPCIMNLNPVSSDIEVVSKMITDILCDINPANTDEYVTFHQRHIARHCDAATLFNRLRYLVEVDINMDRIRYHYMRLRETIDLLRENGYEHEIDEIFKYHKVSTTYPDEITIGHLHDTITVARTFIRNHVENSVY